MQILKVINSDDGSRLIAIVNADTVGKPYMKDGIKYTGYYTCSRCKNASWYDDDYCNNQKMHFVENENSGRRIHVYCENYEVKEI